MRLLYGGFGDNELLQAFHGFRILHYEDVLTRQDWGVQLVDANRIVRLAAQRPKTCRAGMYLGVEAVCRRRNSLLGGNSNSLWAPGLDSFRLLATLTWAP